MQKLRTGVVSLALGALAMLGVTPAAAAGQHPIKTALESVGITKQELRDARARGITLAALAAEQGVSTADLIAAVVAPRYAAIDAAATAAAAAGRPWRDGKVATKKSKELAKVTAHVNVALKQRAANP